MGVQLSVKDVPSLIISKVPGSVSRESTLDFGLCHDLTVGEVKPHISAEPARDSLLCTLSLSLSVCLSLSSLACTLCLS